MIPIKVSGTLINRFMSKCGFYERPSANSGPARKEKRVREKETIGTERNALDQTIVVFLPELGLNPLPGGASSRRQRLRFSSAWIFSSSAAVRLLVAPLGIAILVDRGGAHLPIAVEFLVLNGWM